MNELQCIDRYRLPPKLGVRGTETSGTTKGILYERSSKTGPSRISTQDGSDSAPKPNHCQRSRLVLVPRPLKWCATEVGSATAEERRSTMVVGWWGRGKALILVTVRSYPKYTPIQSIHFITCLSTRSRPYISSISYTNEKEGSVLLCGNGEGDTRTGQRKRGNWRCRHYGRNPVFWVH